MNKWIASDISRGITGLAKVFSVFCFVFTVIFFLCGPASAGARIPAKYSPVKITDGVSVQPGKISWSPDGKRIAYAGRTLGIYDTETGKLKELAIKGPLYVNWTTPEEILFIYREGERNLLCTLDALGLRVENLNPGIEVDAVFSDASGKRLFLVQSSIKRLKIGTDAHFTIFVFDRKQGTTKNILTFGRVLPAKNPGEDYLKGWLHAGLNPFDDSLFIMEHIKPPIMMHYSRISAVDFMTKKVQVITDNGRIKSNIAGSWSPDGRRLALTDAEGYLEMFDKGGVSLPVDHSSPGLYPSWNPRGSQIFVGGYLMDSDGKKKEELLRDGARSISRWSPDGTKIAIISGEDLWLLKDFKPQFIAPDKPLDNMLSGKIRILKALMTQGLLTELEYQERYDRLMREKEDVR